MYGNEAEKKDRSIRITSCGPDSVSFSGLTSTETENLQGMLRGNCWVGISDGRLEVVRRREELPAPAKDEEMLPFWRRPTPGPVQLQLFEIEIPLHSDPAIIITSLCGYQYSAENYRRQAELLESYGFECLRSRREADGQFWELWRLIGLWAAKGELKEALSQKGNGLKKAVRFLCCNVQFGSLEVAYQKAAMPIPD